MRALVPGFAAFASFLLIHGLWFRLGSPVKKAKIVFRLFFLHFLALAAYAAWRQYDLRSGILTMGTLSFLFLGYLEFYFTADRSITTRMMVLTRRCAAEGVTRQEMYKAFPPEKLIQERLDDMVYGGYMHFDGSRYHITAKGRRVAWIYDTTLRILKLRD